MDAYTSFARVYDTFMDNVPYKEWADYIAALLSEYGITDGLVLDLGCGTGSMTELLAEKGYDMIGVDNSEDMLEIAMEKRIESGHDILYLLQNMQEFELYGTVRAIVSVCDCVNYVTEKNELQEVFRLVNNYLDPQGIFIFDFNTEYKYREVLGNQVIAEDRDECSFIWEHYYNHTSMINEYELTGDKDADAEAMEAFAAQWQGIGFVPFKEKDNIAQAYKEAMASKFPEASRRQRRPSRPVLSPKEKLVAKYNQLEQDIVTYENNIGFFAMSKNSAPLIRQMEERIAQAKEELKSLEKQIREMNAEGE